MSRHPRTSTSARRYGSTVLAAATGIACTIALAAAPASAAPDAPSPDRSAAAGNRADGLPKIKGEVGPGFTISINETSVPAGKYKLVVNDMGTIHNFRMKGDGVNRATSVPGTGKEVWKVTLSPGEYKIRCDPHESMKTTLTVT